MDDVLIGAVYGPGPLALYTKAYSLMMLPIRQINDPLSAIAVPALSRLQYNPEHFRRYYCKFIEVLVFFGFPIIGCCALLAKDIVIALLGKQWIGAIPIFIALIPAGLAGLLDISGNTIFISMGRVKEQMRIEFLGSIIVCTSIAIAVNFGPIYIAWSVSLSQIIVLLIILNVALNNSYLRKKDLVASIWRPAIASFGSYFVTLFIIYFFSINDLNPFIKIIIISPGYMIAYALIISMLPEGILFLKELFSMVREALQLHKIIKG
ncbi:hypothetical protein DSCOOX_17020 [Desulfosarcina ovata subsp. ovata]|uniref:Polysaccharide biosynthesis protein C-terminal domain-containing protein n=1 Tax=Desulfosarcina ovata subsp. ovata TaxID=2752305 RepID=A0A5K8A7D4_9BACT|nr:hypothetical protein DSCOOX_17020 [Desulfosarcina ovata subsp. ovata]